MVERAGGLFVVTNAEITTVIPTRNRSTLLQLTLRTVLAQRGVSHEVVVVDDGSTEDVAAVIEGFRDGRVRLVRHGRPTGVSTARNDGAEVARSTWIAFCDDDDLWAPHKLASQLAAAADTARDWSYGGAVRIDAHQRVMGGAPPPPPELLVERLPRWNLMPGGSSNVIVKRDTFWKAGGWDPGLVNLADWDLWIRLGRLGMPACVSEPLVGYRIHPRNASANTALVLQEARILDGRCGNRVDYGELHHYLAWVCLRSGRRWPGFVHLAKAAQRRQAVAAARSALVLAGARVGRLLPGNVRQPRRSAWVNQAEAWLAELQTPHQVMG